MEEIKSDRGVIELSTPEITTKRRRGRPKKKDIEAKKPGKRGKPGRPKGDTAIMNEYRARMLNSPKSEAVMEKIFEAALSDEHKHQAAAWKLIMDRIAPTAAFDRDAAAASKSGGIHIQITTVGGSTEVKGGESPEPEAIDGEWEKVED